MNQDGHRIGELPGAKLARRWRFAEQDLKQWLQTQKRDAKRTARR